MAPFWYFSVSVELSEEIKEKQGDWDLEQIPSKYKANDCGTCVKDCKFLLYN